MLYLIRHANPRIDPTVAANKWQLSSTGIERAHRLAKHLENNSIQAVVTSSEPKACQTAHILAELLGLQVEVAVDLHEHARPLKPGSFFSKDEFNSQVKEFFARPSQLVFGAETADECFERYNRALLEVLAHHHMKTLAIVSHGTVLSLWLSRYNHLEPYAVWKNMGMPACITVCLPDFRISEIWTPPDSIPA